MKMKKSDILKALEGKGDDEEIDLSSATVKIELPAPPVIKNDNIIQMTAVELRKFVDSITKKEEIPDEEAGDIFI